MKGIAAALRSFLRFTFVLGASLLAVFVRATTIPTDVKDSVAFVYTAEDLGSQSVPPSETEPVARGTAFFVGVPAVDHPDRIFLYLVTARHVLRNHLNHRWYPHYFLRLNLRKGGVSLERLPLRFDGADKNVFFDEKDPTADLAVIPCGLDEERYDVKYIPSDLITTRGLFKELQITEGDDVFFTGLFTPLVGFTKNLPIVRFGRVAMAAEQILTIDEEVTTGFLVDSPSFGGNSGSPMFFYLNGTRNPGVLTLGNPRLLLAGLVLGTYLDFEPLRSIPTAASSVSQSSMGISVVLPAYKLHEVLFGGELERARRPPPPSP